MAENTPASIINQIFDDRKNLYWEKVGEVVDGVVEDFAVTRTQAGALEQLESSCKALMDAHENDNFFYYVVLSTSNHASAGLFTPEGKFAWMAFPWKKLAEPAFFQDCAGILKINAKFIALPEE